MGNWVQAERGAQPRRRWAPVTVTKASPKKDPFFPDGGPSTAKYD